MDTSYALNAFRSHDLSIEMRTSSGDTINIDMSNRQELSMQSEKNSSGESASFSFASMQAYSFTVDSNGIDAQDKKEIAAFMEIAQPYIDRFMKELSGGEQKSPMNKIADTIASIFSPAKGGGEAVENLAKKSIVEIFDNAVSQVEQFKELLDETEKLLKKSLEIFDRGEKLLYA
ncbi:MAG: hypothetical protein R3302_05270 [Sulfurimonadaceae bacterium]|nr:hypothetical protein [Sulfurimonadaceae bacterium]